MLFRRFGIGIAFNSIPQAPHPTSSPLATQDTTGNPGSGCLSVAVQFTLAWRGSHTYIRIYGDTDKLNFWERRKWNWSGDVFVVIVFCFCFCFVHLFIAASALLALLLLTCSWPQEVHAYTASIALDKRWSRFQDVILLLVSLAVLSIACQTNNARRRDATRRDFEAMPIVGTPCFAAALKSL